MKQIFITILTVIVIGFLAINTPLSWFNSESLGVSITELNQTDIMSDFPTTYNANLNALNNGKMEMATTSVDSITALSNLVTIGTIGTGVWNGDAIGVGYGGTGTTSPSQFLVILGDATAGLTHASGTGTSGQFLTSNGAGDYPSWQTSAINQNDDYTWTGHHIFSSMFATNASTTNATTTNLHFSGKLTFGSSFVDVALTASSTTYTASGTYNKSTGVKRVFVQVWGAGGGGGADNGSNNNSHGGGGGGSYVEVWFLVADVGASETITIGSGGTGATGGADNATAGGNSTFGSLLTAYGGGKGGSGGAANGGGGGGGGNLAVGGNAVTTTDAGGGGLGGGVAGSPANTLGGGAGSGSFAYYGGGGGGVDDTIGGASQFGGGGGGGGDGAGGVSKYGGDGGAGTADGTGGAGTQPAGGGGGVKRTASGPYTGGAGADGQIIITEFF